MRCVRCVCDFASDWCAWCSSAQVCRCVGVCSRGGDGEGTAPTTHFWIAQTGVRRETESKHVFKCNTIELYKCILQIYLCVWLFYDYFMIMNWEK